MKFRFVVLLLIIGFSNKLVAQETTMKFQDNIDKIFTVMELQGIDTEAEMLYGYFFYGESEKSLRKLGKELVSEDYTLVKVMKQETKYLLRIEKIEVQSRKKLRERKDYFTEKAKKYKVKYDGWDVGHKDGNTPLNSEQKYITFLDGLSNEELFLNSSQLYELGDYRNALIGFDKCLHQKIEVETSLFRLATCFVETGKVATGLAFYKKTLEINPKHEKALFNLATISYDQGNIKSTIYYYKKVLEVNPQRDAAYYGLAAAEYVNKNYQKATAYCNKALAINPNNTLAKDLLQWMK